VIRLMIAAPSAVMRAGLEALVESSPNLVLAGSFPDLGAVDDLRPDVVLAAVSVEELAAVANGYSPAIVLLTVESQPAWSPEAFRMGVRAILPRDAPAESILAAVETAAGGMAVIDPRELEVLLSAGAPVPASAETQALTAREFEVLRMMADGAANKTIAWKLGISEHTVKFHVASILGKLQASTRTEAVTIGIRKGMILL